MESTRGVQQTTAALDRGSLSWGASKQTVGTNSMLLNGDNSDDLIKSGRANSIEQF